MRKTVMIGKGQAGVALVAGAALLLLTLSGCSRRTADAQDNTTSFGSRETSADKAKLFTVPENQMEHVSVVTVEPTRLPRVLRLSGSVAYNNFETTPVITQVGGPVARILVSPGEFVRAGQPLLYATSPDYAQTRTNFLKSRDASALAEKNYARAQDLYAHHAVAEADLLQAESARNQAQADLQAAEQAVKVLGIPRPESLLTGPGSAEIPVRAPIAGEIVERLVGPGQVIQAGATQCFTISNLSTVWVMANVYEKDLGYIHQGDAAAIQTDAYPTTFSGRISYIGAALDPTSRTLQVRIVTNNPGGKLKKDMYVTAEVQAGAVKDALTVPDAAVLRNDENQPFVYVAAGPNQFGQRLVTIGDSQDGKTQVLNGLQAGDRVAADGSLFLQFANSFQK
ncbi:MAG TPA: efflux RND transporter periplasmic adaptor subunit [Terriglobia bacterium]|nr:efflux RND transporter periplasmic adaptor subunit [Terriglobia bacterium]